jgi:hypothetical protein
MMRGHDITRNYVLATETGQGRFMVNDDAIARALAVDKTCSRVMAKPHACFEVGRS